MATLSNWNIHPERGFLPETDPLDKLPAPFAEWDELGYELPKLLVSSKLRKRIDAMPELDPSGLASRAEQERAMMILSYLGHAYLWGEASPVDEFPACLAKPWHALATSLGRHPVLSYASYALHNWRRIDVGEPISLGNIALLQNFLGGIDEEWFILIHVDIEAMAAPALHALYRAQIAVANADVREIETQLTTSADALERMFRSLERMPEHCDPYIYFNRVRPYIHGWKNNPAVPQGVRYAGVAAYHGAPQQFRGETGAQSTIVPAFDAVLGIEHDDDPLRQYLLEMREYMPAEHRAFLIMLEAGPSLRDFVRSRLADQPALREIYNRNVHWVEEFRTLHLGYAASYIQHQHQRSKANPSAIGTGGTPFMTYLKKHRDESTKHLL
ncbi:MAG: hypothetical protein KDD44_04750 [Bdellovibrionales bacterium]|nr:hypothetical protein [Bdellovibrionales bacterium]